MQKIFPYFLCLTFMLSSCAPLASESSPTISIPATATQTLTLSPTPSRTPSPTLTPTASITPLPTIPTFTPTFDVRTIVTATPASKAECPVTIPEFKPNFSLPSSNFYLAPIDLDEITDPILTYLNAGGSLKLAADEIQKITPERQNSYMADVNGDAIPDLISDVPYLWVASCKNGKYELIYFNPEPSEIETIVTVRDLNLDNIPEIIFYDAVPSAASTFYRTLEWSGQDFVDLISNSENDVKDSNLFWYDTYLYNDFSAGGAYAGARFQDLDENGIEEFIVDIGTRKKYDILLDGPWRDTHLTYSWNGHKYMLSQLEINVPNYRFQAIQDGDRMSYLGRFNDAMMFYQNAILSGQLLPYSQENYQEQIIAWEYGTPTPSPLINVDSTEYPRLAAYAYYRMVILHTYLGEMDAAQTQYNTLKEKFGNDPYGQPYVEMATAFWSAYQASNKMYDGCAAAIEYAAEHPDILIPLGSDYHGWQSHIYVPADVCPFR